MVGGRVYIARHGETQSNRMGVYAGRRKDPLTKNGRVQARSLGNALETVGVTRILASPLPRTEETARIVGEVVGVDAQLDDALVEMEFGPWDGLSEKEVAERFPEEHKVWLERPDELRMAGREVLSEVQDRVLEAIAPWGRGDASVLLVTHTALIRTAVLHSQDRPLAEYKQLSVRNCECWLIRPQHEARRVFRPASSDE